MNEKKSQAQAALNAQAGWRRLQVAARCLKHARTMLAEFEYFAGEVPMEPFEELTAAVHRGQAACHLMEADLGILDARVIGFLRKLEVGLSMQDLQSAEEPANFWPEVPGPTPVEDSRIIRPVTTG